MSTRWEGYLQALCKASLALIPGLGLCAGTSHGAEMSASRAGAGTVLPFALDPGFLLAAIVVSGGLSCFFFYLVYKNVKKPVTAFALRWAARAMTFAEYCLSSLLPEPERKTVELRVREHEELKEIRKQTKFIIFR
jgi:hypothetical protein